MQICYIILAHRHPSQVQRLVNRLQSNDTFFYVHIDKRVEIKPFTESLKGYANLWFCEKREEGSWGGLGIVKATLNCLGQILKDGRKGYCVLLSGQDYPLKTVGAIADHLQNADGANFADTWAIPDQRWHTGGLDRIENYKYHLPSVPRQYVLLPPVWSAAFYRNKKQHVRNIFELLKHGRLPLRLLRRRRFPSMVKPYGGSQWWAVTTGTAEKIISFVQTHKSYLKYHNFTLLPDEIFFQTLIMHISLAESRTVKPSLTYVRFAGPEEAHPLTFSTEHFAELKETHRTEPGKLFARKFNPNDTILNWLDTL